MLLHREAAELGLPVRPGLLEYVAQMRARGGERYAEALRGGLWRAVGLHHRLAALKMQRTASAFNRFRQGVLMVDDACRILYANRAAEAMLAAAGGLRRDPDSLAAGRGNGIGLPGSGGRHRIRRGAGRAPLSVLVVPVRTEVGWLAFRRPPQSSSSPTPTEHRAQSETLRRRFLLTPAETTFVEEIIKGDGLKPFG